MLGNYWNTKTKVFFEIQRGILEGRTNRAWPLSMLSTLGASNNSEATSGGNVACVRHSVLRCRLVASTEWQTQATGPAQLLVLYYETVVQVINGHPGPF